MVAGPVSSPLLRRGLFLEYLTLGWNVAGSGVSRSCAMVHTGL